MHHAIIEAVRARLSADADLAAIVAARVYGPRAPDSAEKPRLRVMCSNAADGYGSVFRGYRVMVAMDVDNGPAGTALAGTVATLALSTALERCRVLLEGWTPPLDARKVFPLEWDDTTGPQPDPEVGDAYQTDVYSLVVGR